MTNEETVEPVQPAPNSFIAQIQALRAELAAAETLDLLVPGYDGRLAVRYKTMADKELELLRKKAAKVEQNGKDIEFACDFIINCCDDILIAENDVLVPIRGDVKTTFSSGALVDLFALDAQTAREEVLEIFSPNNTQRLAPAAHVQALQSWMQGSLQEIDKELLGE